MKPINSAAILDQLLQWVFYFKHGNKRLPLSLEDLTENSPKDEDDDDLNPTLNYYRENGYSIMYKISEGTSDSFELTVQYENEEPCHYKGKGDIN